MILLLEGVNCCGKSSLAQKLAADFELEIVKFSMAPMEKTFEYFHDSLDAAAKRSPHFIVDRAHLSNAVYGDLQGSGLLNPSEWQALDDWFAQRGAWLFLMTDDVFRVEARVEARGRAIDSVIGRAQLAALQRRYERFYNQSRIAAKGQYSLTLFFDLAVAGNNLACSEETTELYDKLKSRIRQEIG